MPPPPPFPRPPPWEGAGRVGWLVGERAWRRGGAGAAVPPGARGRAAPGSRQPGRAGAAQPKIRCTLATNLSGFDPQRKDWCFCCWKIPFDDLLAVLLEMFWGLLEDMLEGLLKGVLKGLLERLLAEVLEG